MFRSHISLIHLPFKAFQVSHLGTLTFQGLIVLWEKVLLLRIFCHLVSLDNLKFMGEKQLPTIFHCYKIIEYTFYFLQVTPNIITFYQKSIFNAIWCTISSSCHFWKMNDQNIHSIKRLILSSVCMNYSNENFMYSFPYNDPEYQIWFFHNSCVVDSYDHLVW